MNRTLQDDRAMAAVRLLGVGAAYVVAAELGLRLALVGNSVTPLWPPTGVAIVALIMFGFRIWPAIAVSAFAVNAPISPNLLTAGAIAAGNTLAPLAAAYLLRRVGFDHRLERVRDALAIVFLAALASMSLSATVGTTALVWSGAVPGARYFETWSVWWAGDAMGVLIVAPFLWSLRPYPAGAFTRRRGIEAAALLALLVGVVQYAIRQDHALFLVFPVLGWIAWRFQQRGAGPAAVIASATVIFAAAHSSGPFMADTLLKRMFVLQTFNAAVAFTSFFFAAAVAERLEIERERQLLAEAEREAQMRLYEREHDIAETLQRSLLPEYLVTTPGVAVAARYIPASGEGAVGGDWYDIIPLPYGRMGVVIGDVAGHGIGAAAAMGQIRMALRAYAVEDLPPAEALRRLNVLLLELQPGALSTVWYGHYDPDEGSLNYCSAGHPPPLLVDAAGASYLEGAVAPPLGVSPHIIYSDSAGRIDVGTTAYLYTDGLVERRKTSLDHGLKRLLEVASSAPADLDDSCDYILNTLVGSFATDDVALLAIRATSLAGRQLRLHRPASPSTVPEVRRIMRRWLTQNGAAAQESYEVLVAFAEAFTNAVQHAYGSGEGVVEITAELQDGEVLIAVRDHGAWKAAGAESRDGGRGLSMMRKLMHRIDIASDTSGTEVRMRRTLVSP